MAVFLDRIDTVPLLEDDFSFAYRQWVANLVDSLNEVINDIQDLLLSQNIVTETTQDVEVNSIYIPTNVALTTFQMPDECNVGNRLTIAGFGAGGWTLLMGMGQTVQLAADATSASTSISSSSRYDSIELICVETNLTWITLSTQTTGFVIV